MKSFTKRRWLLGGAALALGAGIYVLCAPGPDAPVAPAPAPIAAPAARETPERPLDRDFQAAMERDAKTATAATP
jgi:hypothetical protein